MARQISVALVVFALALGLAGPVAPTGAEEQIIRVDGLVQWIGGQQMIVQADTGLSVDVDLASVRQDEYAGLGVRDRVAVTGMVSPDGRRLIGTSIVRSPRAREAPAPRRMGAPRDRARLRARCRLCAPWRPNEISASRPPSSS